MIPFSYVYRKNAPIFSTMRTCIVVMGVAGAGKTTVGEALARAHGAPFCDADDLHTPAAVAKMARGEALTDEDRWPWIVRVREAAERAANPRCVVACSCLRRAYRDVLRATEMRVVFVYLPVDPCLLYTSPSPRD